MPTSPVGNRGGIGGEDGFTLFELLVVMAILSLAVSAVGLSVSRRTDRMSVQRIAAELTSRARATREQAIETGRDAVLVIDVGQRVVTTQARQSPLTLPADIDVEVVTVSDENRGNAVSGIRFFPDGSATGGTIRIGRAGSVHEIHINWFTGRVRVVEPQ